MRYNSYWTRPSNRKFKKYGTRIIISLKEIGEISWAIYGVILQFSPEATGCSDGEKGFVALAFLLIILTALKVVIIIIGLFAMCILACRRY